MWGGYLETGGRAEEGKGTSKMNSKKLRPKPMKRAQKRKVLINPVLFNGH